MFETLVEYVEEKVRREKLERSVCCPDVDSFVDNSDKEWGGMGWQRTGELSDGR